MESSKRKVGRPKSEPRNGPLVLDEDRDRQKTEVELTAATARELGEYAAWVEMSSSLTTADATFTTVEFALRDLFRRDRVWRERRHTLEANPSGAALATPATPAAAPAAAPARPPASSPPSLPSPSPRETRTTT
jgi:hypothetical protein